MQYGGAAASRSNATTPLKLHTHGNMVRMHVCKDLID